MYIKGLSLRNIGPFKEASLEFLSEDQTPPVVFITGENGTGKTILLDAIRGMFGPHFSGQLERNLQRTGSNLSEIELLLLDNSHTSTLRSRQFKNSQIDIIHDADSKLASGHMLGLIPYNLSKGDSFAPRWIVDYWPSVLASGRFEIQNLANPQHNLFLSKALSGERHKKDVTNMICHFDYLRDSRNSREKAIGQRMYQVLEQLIEHSLLDGGKLKDVSRSRMEPILEQNGHEIGWQNLSSGNLYLIQSLVGLLSRMYSVNILRNEPPEQLCQTPGVLLIDEAENQLHPKWQKRLIKTILIFFPNLQIIATTHSPFIIASVENVKLFVCRAMGDHCVVEDVSADYSNKPVDEILMSPLFEETQPYSEKITDLLTERKQAIIDQDWQKRTRIENLLQKLNPSEFGYFDIEELVSEVLGEPAS